MASIVSKKQHDSATQTQIPLFLDKSVIGRFWISTLFNDVYLRNEVPIRYEEKWAKIESGAFQKFYDGFLDLCVDLDDIKFETWSETETISKWIKPVMELLGWHDNCRTRNQTPYAEEQAFTIEENAHKKTYRPDLLYFDDPAEVGLVGAEREASQKVTEARQYVIMPLEAKYWNRLEEYRQGEMENAKKVENRPQDSVRTLAPDEQCLKYMEILDKNYGILSDGSTWRLFHKNFSQGSSRRFYQFNLGDLRNLILGGIDDPSRRLIFLEAAKYFFYFFSKESHFSESKSPTFVDEILEFSKRYASRAEQDLKHRFIKAMNHACNGLLASAKKLGESLEISQIRTVCESHLFNILFIRYCEAKQILPMSSINYRKISLSKILDTLDERAYDPDRDARLNSKSLSRAFEGDFKFTDDGTDIYDRLIRLTLTVLDGTTDKDNFGFNISGFKQTVFSKEECKLVKRLKISNRFMVPILFELGFTRDSEVVQKKFQQIPYHFFSPRQLGSIYESFLEFRLESAGQDMAYVKKQWIPASLTLAKIRDADIPKVKKGDLFFSPDNSERKASGSYYTPDTLAKYVVNETLFPLVKGKKSSEILKIKVCDPTMGSAHFLTAAMEFLTKAYMESLEREEITDKVLNDSDVKSLVLENCIFGTDLNPRAVKLARMSLWLESASAGKKLLNLDSKVYGADSLIPRCSEYPSGFESTDVRYCAIVSNPPWEKLKFDEMEFFKRWSKGDISKKLSKSEKTKAFAALLNNSEIRCLYDKEKKEVESKLEAINTGFYEHQENEAGGDKSRFIDINLYKLAVERFCKMLSNKGRLGIVVPTGLFGDLGCSGLRKYITENFSVQEIIGFSEDAKVFPEITQAVSLLILEPGKTSDFSYIDAIESEAAFLELIPKKNAHIRINLELIHLLDQTNLIFPYIRSDVDLSITKKMYKYCLKKERLTLDCGRELHQTDDAKYLVEKRNQYPVLKGEDIAHFRVIENGRQFLSDDGVTRHGSKRSDTARIAFRAIAGQTLDRRLMATMISGDVLTVNSLLVTKGDYSKSELTFILALLNSRIFEYRFKQISKNNNVNKFAINSLPFPKFDSQDSKHVKIVELSSRLLDKRGQPVNTVADDLDKKVCDLFGLTEKETKHIFSKIKPFS